MTKWRVALATTVLASSLLVGCGVQGDEPAEIKPTPGVRTHFSGIVVDYGLGEGPILCSGVVALSDPPQCGGYPLIGWDWEVIEHDEFPPPDDNKSPENITRSGDYSFDGTFTENEQIEVFPETITASKSLAR